MPANQALTHLTLRDGRKAQVEEYGDPTGTPVIWLHGAFSSRLEAAFLDTPARERRLRILAPDRPGVGGSDPLPGHTVMGYVDDVRDIIDGLRLERVVVGGWSNGGMYAMAVASAFPERVARVVAVNPSTPVADRAARQALTRKARMAYTLAERKAPQLAARMANQPQGGVAATLARWMNPDAHLFEDPARAAWMAASTAEVLRQPDSPYLVREIGLAPAPWGFDHRAVTVPVIIVSGERDAGDNYAKVWARELPNGQLVSVPGGHQGIVAPAAARQIVDALSTSA